MMAAVMGTFLVIILIIVMVLLISCVKIVRQAQALVIERLGAYQATWGTGLHFKLPIVDRVARRVDMKEQVVDFLVWSGDSDHGEREPDSDNSS